MTNFDPNQNFSSLCSPRSSPCGGLGNCSDLHAYLYTPFHTHTYIHTHNRSCYSSIWCYKFAKYTYNICSSLVQFSLVYSRNTSVHKGLFYSLMILQYYNTMVGITFQVLLQFVHQQILAQLWKYRPLIRRTKMWLSAAGDFLHKLHNIDPLSSVDVVFNF